MPGSQPIDCHFFPFFRLPLPYFILTFQHLFTAWLLPLVSLSCPLLSIDLLAVITQCWHILGLFYCSHLCQQICLHVSSYACVPWGPTKPHLLSCFRHFPNIVLYFPDHGICIVSHCQVFYAIRIRIHLYLGELSCLIAEITIAIACASVLELVATFEKVTNKSVSF